MRDIKIPADASDKQTTDAKTALPPLEFKAAKTATANVVTVTDRTAVQNRATAAAYRVYFLPSQFGSLSNPSQRQAGVRMASLVTEIAAPGRGGQLSYPDTTNLGKTGTYYCVAVNRSGVESVPQHILSAP